MLSSEHRHSPLADFPQVFAPFATRHSLLAFSQLTIPRLSLRKSDICRPVTMKRYILIIFLCLLQHFTLHAQVDTIDQRIILIGDAGQLTGGKHPIVDAVRRFIQLDKKTTIIFLGDNLYPKGLPDENSINYVMNCCSPRFAGIYCR